MWYNMCQEMMTLIHPEELRGASLDARFTQDVLIELYQEVGRPDRDALLDAARCRWPDCCDADVLPITVHEAPMWRMFRQLNGTYVRPAWSIMGCMLDEIFVMPDGAVERGK